MRFEYDTDIYPHMIATAIAKVPRKAREKTMAIVATTEAGQLVCGANVFYNSEWEMEVSLYVTNKQGGTRAIINEIMRYVFGHCGVDRLIAKIDVTNKQSFTLAKRIGFTQEAIMKKSHNGIDQHLMRLLKEEWETSKYKR